MILDFAGKDASEKFNTIHPPGVIEKYAPSALIGKVRGAPGAAPAAAGGLTAPLLAKDELTNEYDGTALWVMAFSFIKQVCKTIFCTGNIKFANDRLGLSRSAIFLMFFMVIHADGNLHIFLGPDDFNGYGHFYVRLYWTGFGLPANIVEIYLLLAALLHVSVALKRTYDINRNYPLSITGVKMNLAITGVLLLAFMIIHLSQFRFGETQEYMVRPPPYLINFWGISRMQLFWVDDPTVKPVPVRDIYKLEFDLFQEAKWVIWYVFCTAVFLVHGCLGWRKLVPAPLLRIPKKHHGTVTYYGYAIFAFVACCYFSFPMYCYFGSMKQGNLGHI